MCKYTIPEMIKTGGGSIVNTASIAALIGGASAHAYTASKGGMVALGAHWQLSSARRIFASI